MVHGGGSILIRSFAVGRAQTLIYLIYQLRKNKQIPEFPIHLDSLMPESTASIYHHFENNLRINSADVDAMIGMTKCIKTPEKSRRLNSERSPKVIISESGMTTGGRVLHHMIKRELK